MLIVLWVFSCGALSLSIDAQESFDVSADIQFQPHPYFTHSSKEIYKEIFVLKGGERLTIGDVLDINDGWELNTTREDFDRKSTYWARLDFTTDESETILIEFGDERLNSWREVDYYLYSSDSLIAAGHTGIDLKPAEKTLRNALNLALLPLPAGRSTVYVHLRGHHLIIDDPRWEPRYSDLKGDISFYIHDQDTYSSIDAYKYPGFFTQNRRGHFFATNFFKECLEVRTDPTGDLTVAEVSSGWDRHARYAYDDYPDADSIYWMRFKVIGDDIAPRHYLFGLSSGTHWNYDKIEVYHKNSADQWQYQITGNRISKNDKSIKTDWNLFNIDVMPRDTQEIFLRLEGAGRRFIPEFSMVHFDEPSFWSRIFTIQALYGAFYGILIVQSFYFLILGFLEKEWLHYWFVVFIIGFGLSLGFIGGDVNYFMFPSIEFLHPWLAALGGFLIVFGLFRYLVHLLQLDRIFSYDINTVLTPLILMHLMVCLYFAVSLYSIGGSIAVYQTYFQIFFASLILNFVVALAIGIVAWIDKSIYAMYFVGAFAALIFILVIRLIFAFGSFDQEIGFNQDTIVSGLYMHYLLFLGIILTIILLGFTNGFRVNRLKIDASNALLKYQQEGEMNTLLTQKNKVIQERVEENEILVKEIHHRVKNNLQVLASLLSLQSQYITDPIAYEAVIKGKSRVDAIGLVHQLLYLRDTTTSSIDMSLYLQELCLYLEDSLTAHEQSVDIKCDLEVKHLDLDTSIPLGLTITELVTNSFKHGLTGRTDGVIYIKIWISDDQRLCLNVSDNGYAENKDGSDRDTKSFGKELILLLTQKLKGEITIDTTEGHSTTIRYKRFKHYNTQ